MRRQVLVLGDGAEPLVKSKPHFYALTNQYMQRKDDAGEMITFTGVLGSLGIWGHHALQEFLITRPEYSIDCERLRLLCEDALVSKVANTTGNTAGQQFLLKTLHNHAERNVVEVKAVQIHIDGTESSL